ncbi:PepSY domain-containing protein [Shewanella maritima]|uniref:PepSY domain-containing protein n=1 Tax=Shewanella maritima TaxID=2520507 RepID=A0A411PII4_9GAMM|nr:PepSY-associated TM helix domain-containing protein [Shewanella maritima]QBF83284.1 PepSY domain-containing protein [Shewanella maritima]
MKSLTIKKLFQLHSWVGVVTGVLLFIVAFTGAVAVFARPELVIWSNTVTDDVPQAVSGEQVQKLVNHYSEKVPAEFTENIHIYMPTGYNYTDLTLLFESHHGDENHEHAAVYAYEIDSNTLELKREFYGATGDYYMGRKYNSGSFIGHFHADLHLGRPIGLILTGFMGLTLMVSVITGLYIHREMFKQLFTFRREKSFSVLTSDAHKLFGLWGSVFHLVIGFTGAFLGLATVILLPAAAYVSFNGDQDKLVETFTAMPEPVISQEYQPTEIASIMSSIEQIDQKAVLMDLTLMALNDKNSVVYARMMGGENFASELLEYKGNGEFAKSMSSLGDINGWAITVIEWLFPLHFGNFSGVFVKFLWGFLGLSTALIPLSGVMMWLAKRSRGNNSDLSPIAYQRWNRFVIGSCGGIVLACAAMFPAQVILNATVVGVAQNSWFAPIFFGSWVAWLVLCILPIEYRRLLKANTLLVALLLTVIMPLKLFTVDGYLGYLFSAKYSLVAAIDVSFLILGLLSFYVAGKVKTQSMAMNTEVLEEKSA